MPDLNNLSPFERWQIEAYGDMLEKTSQRSEEFENGIISLEENERWLALEEERWHNEQPF